MAWHGSLRSTRTVQCAHLAAARASLLLRRVNQPAAAAGSYSIRDGYSCTCLRETAVRAYVGLQTAAPTPERNLTFLLGFEPRQSTGHREMDGWMDGHGSTSPVTSVRARDKLADHYYPPQHGKKRQHDRTTNLVKVRTPMHDLWPSRSLFFAFSK